MSALRSKGNGSRRLELNSASVIGHTLGPGPIRPSPSFAATGSSTCTINGNGASMTCRARESSRDVPGLLAGIHLAGASTHHRADVRSGGL